MASGVLSNALGSGSDLTMLTIWGAFFLGLTGGFGHCLMMCGPFVAATSLADGTFWGGAKRDAATTRRAWLFQLGYHAGRLLTYTALGAALGLLGGMGRLSSLAAPFSPGAISRYVRTGAGVFLIVTGVWLVLAWASHRSVRLPDPSAAVTRSRWFARTTDRLARGGWRYSLPLGMLLGLLPCAPLLPAEVTALASGSWTYGALVMLAFGLGTVPALAGFGAASGLVGGKVRGWFVPASGAAVMLLGVATTLQGIRAL